MTIQRYHDARRATCLVLTAALVAGAGCTLDDLHHDGRYCAAAFPCSEGFVCVGQACVASTTSDSGPLDAARDATKDGPSITPDRNPVLEGGADTVTDGAADTGPQPDLGCTGGKIACGGACIDPFSDIKHCGGCDKACPGSADRCQQGKCHCGDNKPLCQGGLNCTAGACACLVGPGSLCGGCCASGVCHPGSSTSLCGAGGVACQTCGVSNACLTPTCSAGLCGANPRPDGYPCSGGRCYSSACCTGCHDTVGTSCRSGTSLLYCGKGGLSCENCKALKLVCINQSCVK